MTRTHRTQSESHAEKQEGPGATNVCLAELRVLLATNCDCVVALCSFRYSVLVHTHNPNS